MSTEKKKTGIGLYFLPLAAALPIAAGIGYGLYRIWPLAQKAINLLLKVAVKAS